MTQFGTLAQREQEHWIVLQPLERQDAPTAGTRRWRVLESIAGARNEGLILNAVAEQMTKLAAGLGIGPNGALAKPAIGSSPICQPLFKVQTGN